MAPAVRLAHADAAADWAAPAVESEVLLDRGAPASGCVSPQPRSSSPYCGTTPSLTVTQASPAASPRGGREPVEQGTPEGTPVVLPNGLVDVEQAKGVVLFASSGSITDHGVRGVCAIVASGPRFDFYKISSKRQETLPRFDERFDTHYVAITLEQDNMLKNISRKPQDLHRGTRIPSTVRPAVTLLRLLGRVHFPEVGYPQYHWAAMYEVIPSLPASGKEAREAAEAEGQVVEKPGVSDLPVRWRGNLQISRVRYNGFQETLVELPQRLCDLPADMEVRVDAAALDQTGRVLTSQWYEAACEEEGIPRDLRYEFHSEGGGPVRRVPKFMMQISRALFGDGHFSITAGELCELANSTTLVTSGDIDAQFGIPREESVPQSFLLSLIGDQFFHKHRAWFFNAVRFLPLDAVADEDKIAQHNQSQSATFARLLKENHADITKTEKEKDTLLADRGSFMEWGTKFTPPGADAEKKASGAVQKLVLQRVKRMSLAQRLALALDVEGHRLAVRHFKQWRETLLSAPERLGFENKGHAERVLGRAAVQLATETCIAQKGYFMLGSTGPGTGGQLLGQTRRPVVFLSIAAIDFGSVQTTKLEASQFFEKDPAVAATSQGWIGFRDGGEARLRTRLRKFYATIFTAAQKQGVTHPSMLPIGLGVFVSNLKKPDKRPDGTKITDFPVHDAVVRMYFEAQCDLLSESSWGFDTYFLSIPPNFVAVASATLKERAERLQCNVVLHDRDAKAIAVAVADSGDDGAVASFLNPSDCRAVLMGSMGMFWEEGYGVDYVGEEDFGATSTGVLADFHICGEALGIGDIFLLAHEEPCLDLYAPGAPLPKRFRLRFKLRERWIEVGRLAPSADGRAEWEFTRYHAWELRDAGYGAQHRADDSVLGELEWYMADRRRKELRLQVQSVSGEPSYRSLWTAGSPAALKEAAAALAEQRCMRVPNWPSY